MMIFSKNNVSLAYFRFLNKKCLKILGSIIASVGILAGIIMLSVFLITKFISDNAIIEKVQVGVVIPEEQDVLKVAARYASTVKSVDAICDFNYYVDQEDAMSDLEEGKIEVCVFFSEEFYEQVDSEFGIIQKVYINDNGSLSLSLFRNLLEDGIKLLQTSAAGIYSAYDTANQYDAPLSKKEIDSLLMDIYVDRLLNRLDLFESEIVSPIGNLNLERYVFFCIFVISMLLPGLYFSGMYKKQSQCIEQKLRIYGVTGAKMFAIRTMIYVEMIWIVSMIVYVLGCFFTERLMLNLVYWDVLVAIKIIPCCLLLGIFYNSIYSLCGAKAGIQVILLVIVWIIIGTGIIIPICYLPEVLQKLESILHTTNINKYILEIIYGNVYNVV